MSQIHTIPTQKAETLHRSADGRTVLYSCGNLKLTKLKGSATQRAYNHGRLATEQGLLSTAVLKYFTMKSEEPVATLPGPFRLLGKKALVSWLSSWHEHVPRAVAEELSELARGAGVSPDDIILAASGPDLGNASNAWLLNPAIGWAKLRFGCTSVSGRNKKGDFALARNLDFPGVGIYDKIPEVTLHLPESKDELKRISIAAELIHFASISAINEAGIGLVVHQNYHRSPDTKSIPLIYVGDLVLRKARTLQEAIAILRAHPPGPLWTFVLFDVKTGEACSVEAAAKHFGVRPCDSETGYLGQSNHCLTSAGLEIQSSPLGTYRNSCQRLARVRTLAGDFTQLDDLVPAFARVLADKGPGAQGHEFDVHESIIKPCTIQSVIFDRRAGDKGLGTVWITQDEAPASSGRYIGLDLDALFAMDSEEGAAEAPVYRIADFVGASHEERECQKRLAEASRLSFDERKDAEALKVLESHKMPGALFTRAVLAARCGRYSEAEGYASQALTHDLPAYIRESVTWVRCVALHESGRVSEARKLAVELTAHGVQNSTIAPAAERLARGFKLRGHERNLVFDFFAGDLDTLPQAPD